MNNLTKAAVLLSLALMSTLLPKFGFCDEIWSQEQLIKHLESGSVREIGIASEGIRGKYLESHGQLEGFLVLGKYDSFSPEIIALIQNKGVHVFPYENHSKPDTLIYGALLLQVSAWIIILVGVILLVKINTKLNKILDVVANRKA